MTQVVKPKCASSDSEKCQACFAKFPSDNFKYFRDDNGTPTDPPPKGAGDKECKVCYPYDGRKGKGCGGVGLTPSQAKNSTMVGISGKHTRTHTNTHTHTKVMYIYVYMHWHIFFF